MRPCTARCHSFHGVRVDCGVAILHPRGKWRSVQLAGSTPHGVEGSTTRPGARAGGGRAQSCWPWARGKLRGASRMAEYCTIGGFEAHRASAPFTAAQRGRQGTNVASAAVSASLQTSMRDSSSSRRRAGGTGPQRVVCSVGQRTCARSYSARRRPIGAAEAPMPWPAGQSRNARRGPGTQRRCWRHGTVGAGRVVVR